MMNAELLIPALLLASSTPLVFRWRRKYIAIIMILLLLGPLSPIPEVARAEVFAPRLIRVDKGPGPPFCSDYERLRRFEALPPPGVLFIEAYDAGVTFTFTFANATPTTYAGRPAYRLDLRVTASSGRTFTVNEFVAVDLRWSTDWGSGTALSTTAGNDMPIDRTFTVTLPADAIYVLHLEYQAIAAPFYCGDFAVIYFIFTQPLATNRTAVSLVTKFMFNSGFGQDNPIDYKGPTLPRGVEQRITGLEMLTESMMVREYSMQLLPDWAVDGKITNALIGIWSAQPSFFGTDIPVPGQEWVERPSAVVFDPKTVAFKGKIRSDAWFDFPTRFAFPFAPYYEFPTVMELPLDLNEVGGSTIQGMENASFLMQMKLDVNDHVFLSLPWTGEGDIMSYVFAVGIALSGVLPSIPKLREAFAKLGKLKELADRIITRRGGTPLPSASSSMENAIREGLENVLNERVATANLHLENVPRLPTASELPRLPPEQRAAYEQIADAVISTRDTARVAASMASKYSILDDSQFVRQLSDRLFDAGRSLTSSYPVGSPEYIAGFYLERLSLEMRTTGKLTESLEVVVKKLLTALDEAPPGAMSDYYNALDIFIRKFKEASGELVSEAEGAFGSAFEEFLFDTMVKIEEALLKIRASSVSPSLAGRDLRPRVFYEGLTVRTISFASLAPVLKKVAQGAIRGLWGFLADMFLIGFSIGYATIQGREWQDPGGVAMGGIVAFKVRTPEGVRLAYIWAVAPDIGFGALGMAYNVRDIMDKAIREVSDSLGYGPPAPIDRIVGNSPQEVIGMLSTYFWTDIDDKIAVAVGFPKSQIKLLGVAVMPVYIPYSNTGAHRVGTANVFDFTDAVRAIINKGIRFEFKAIIARDLEIDDPNQMINLMHPVLVNGIEVDRSDWKIVRTRVGSTLKDRPLLSYPLDVRAVGEQPRLLVETKTKVPISSVVRVNVTQEFMWDPTTSQGGFGVPCIADKKYFEGLFQVLNIRFYRYPVIGTSPPDEVVFTVRAENATIRKVYGADILKFDGASFRVPGSSFHWIKVGEDSSLGITYWDGELKKGVKLDVFSFVLRCGYGLDVSVGSRDATRGVISGSVSIDGSALQGSSTLPTKAIFTVNAYRPPSQPNPPRITAEMVVGYHFVDPEGGPKWIQFWRDVRTFDSFPARVEASIGDLVMAALELANRTGRPVTIRADMALSGAPPGYMVIQPDPAEWVAQPGPLVGRVWRLTVIVMNATDRARISGALVTVQNKSHTFNATTDATGVASFSLTTGSYEVRATASGYTQAKTSVNLVKDTDVVLLLEKAPSRQATVTVYVYDGHTSAPIQGARVTLDSTEQTTGSDGRAVFANVPFGSYVLQVTKSGYSPYRRSIDVMNDTVRIDVALMQERPKVTATVTVVNARTGAPVAGATVQFENGTMVYTGTTGTDGIARITLPVGGYTLRVSASGFYPFSQTVFVPQSGFSTTVRLAPTTDEPEPPKPPVPPEECDIPLTTIKVIDATNGAGIAGAHVTLVRGGFTYEGTTDSNGEAKFCITSGLYSYRVERAGYQTVEGTSFIAKGTTFVITMTPLSAIPSGRLTVIVRDAASTSPIEGAEVTVQNSTHVLRKYTDGNGRAQFTLIAGGYLLTVRKSGYRDFSASLEFPGGDVNYIVSLTPHGLCEYPGNWTEPVTCGYRWLVIDVRYRDGFPFAGASVTVSNSTMSVTATTDGLGIAKFRLSPGTYTVSISATEGPRSYSTSFSVNLDQNLWIMRFVPWYSPYFSPEVYPLYATFVGPRRGVWNQEHLIAVGFYSNVPQTITAKVSAINYTRYARDGTVQELASATFTVRFTDSAINSTLLLLNVMGSGVALVAPMVTILSYQNDTFTGNNRLVGDPILFGPMLDVSLRIIVEVDSAPTGALVPEITRMRITVEFWANQEVPVPGRLMARAHFVSAENGRRLERPLMNESVIPRIDVQNRTVTYYLEWTNVTVVSISFFHDLEVNEIDNNQTAYIYLDRAIKLVAVRAPKTVRSDSYFYVNITVLSNWWPSWEYGYLAKLGSAAATGSFRAGFGYTNVTVYARAPAVSAPTTMELNMTVGPDFAPHDNSKVVAVQVVPETWLSVPWIILLLGMAAIGAGAVATARTARRAQAVYRRRRALRPAGEWSEWCGQDASGWVRGENSRRRRRALR